MRRPYDPYLYFPRPRPRRRNPADERARRGGRGAFDRAQISRVAADKIRTGNAQALTLLEILHADPAALAGLDKKLRESVLEKVWGLAWGDDWFPEHKLVTVCPRGHEEFDDGFRVIALEETSFPIMNVDVNEDESEGLIVIRGGVDEVQEPIPGSRRHLHCLSCRALWPIPKGVRTDWA